MASGTGTVAGIGPIAIVGELIYNGDGTGNVVMLTQSVNGATSTATNIPVSFTVNPDCTGSKTVGTGHYNFVITPDGSLITWIVIDNGVTLMGTGVYSRSILKAVYLRSRAETSCWNRASWRRFPR